MLWIFFLRLGDSMLAIFVTVVLPEHFVFRGGDFAGYDASNT